MISYNILWVDDKIFSEPLQKLTSSIEAYVMDMGLIPTIEKAANYAEASKKIKGKRIDLLITDNNISSTETNIATVNDDDEEEEEVKPGEEGFSLIKKLRNANKLTDVLFYSAVLDEFLTNNAIDSILQDRVTYCEPDLDNDYHLFKKRIRALIDASLDRYRDLTTLRGVIISQASSIDFKISQILYAYHQSLQDSSNLLDHIKRIIRESYKSILKKCSSCPDENLKLQLPCDDFARLLDNHSFDSYKRARVLAHIIAANNIDFEFSSKTACEKNTKTTIETVTEKKSSKIFFEAYKRVSNIRNVIAHSHCMVNNDNREALVKVKYADSPDKIEELSRPDCFSIIRDFNDIEELIENIDREFGKKLENYSSLMVKGHT